MNTKYTPIILAGGKGQELYPLTEKYPKALLPIANKKLIFFQIQLLERANFNKIIILINQLTKKVQQEIRKLYKGKSELIFISTQQQNQTYEALSQLLKKVQINTHAILLPSDVITNISISSAINFHQQKKSDITFLLKIKQQEQKKQKQEKKGKEKEAPQIDYDIFVTDQNNRIFFTESRSEIEFSGVKFNNCLLKQIKKAKFNQVFDSHIYILNKRVLTIIKNLQNQDLQNFKTSFLPFLIKNQNNINLLNFSHNEGELSTQKGLKSYAYFYNQEYLKRIIDLNDFQTTNFKGLIRGNKQLPVLLPTNYTDKLIQNNYESTLISQGVQIKEGVKIKRSSISSGVKLGKNSQIVNCIVLKDVVIQQNSKIYNSLIGAKSIIKRDLVIKQCQVGYQAVVKNSLANQIIIQARNQ